MTTAVDSIAVGWTVWEKRPDGADYLPRGGVVFNVHRRNDFETGEVITVFDVLGQGDASRTTGKLVLHSLRAEQVGEASEPNSGVVGPYVNLLLTEMHRTKTATRRRAQLSEIFCRLRNLC